MDTSLQDEFRKRFAELPLPVQRAITSAEVEAHLRGLAEKHKLHLDQWQILENEVMLSLYGFLPVEELQSHIQKEVGVDAATAAELVVAVSEMVFDPIRKELERQLEHPQAVEKEKSNIETIVEAEKVKASAPAAVPAAPPTPRPQTEVPKVARPSQSTAYRPGEPSHARTSIVDDPYREPPL